MNTTTNQKLAEVQKAIREIKDEILALQLAKGIAPDEQLGFSGQPTDEAVLSKTEAQQAALGRMIARRFQR